MQIKEVLAMKIGEHAAQPNLNIANEDYILIRQKRGGERRLCDGP